MSRMILNDSVGFLRGGREEVRVPSGARATLPCRLKGRLPSNVDVYWLRQDPVQLLTKSQDPRYVIKKKDNITFDLHIVSVTLRDEGVYVCQLNTRPLLSRSVQLRIGRSPTIRAIRYNRTTINITTNLPTVITFPESTAAAIACEASGYPLPDVHWIKVPLDRAQPQNTTAMTVPSNGTGAALMVFESISRSEAGPYRCTARNVYGEVVRGIELAVQYVPTMQPLPAIIHAGVSSYIRVPCAAHGVPAPQYEWTKQDPGEGDRFITNKQTLVIVQLQPAEYGYYTCSASNAAGVSSSTVEISGRPMAPSIVSPAYSPRRHSYNLLLDSQTDSDSPFGTTIQLEEFVLNYRRRFNDDEEEAWSQEIIPFKSTIKVTSHVIRDLYANTAYELEVYGRNEFGDGERAHFMFTTAVEDRVYPMGSSTDTPTAISGDEGLWFQARASSSSSSSSFTSPFSISFNNAVSSVGVISAMFLF